MQFDATAYGGYTTLPNVCYVLKLSRPSGTYSTLHLTFSLML